MRLLRPLYLLGPLSALLIAPATGLAAGGLDPSFGKGGIVPVPFGMGGYANAVAAGPGGRVLATGTGPGWNGPGSGFAVAVLAGDRPDPGFGRAGRVTVARTRRSTGGYGSAVAPAGAGQIVAAGTAAYDNDGFIWGRLLVTRLTASGRPDRSFGGGDGVVVLGHVPLRGGTSTNDGAAGVVVQPGGKVLIAGRAARILRNDDQDHEAPRDQAFVFVRLNRDGSIDRNFGRAGRLVVRFPGATLAAMSAVAVNARGRILAAGRAGPRPPFGSPPRGRLALVRLLPSGRLDPAFGRSGRVFDPTDLAFNLEPGALAVQPDGKPVINLTTGTLSKPVWAVRRLTASGQPDPAFGPGGQRTVEIPGSSRFGPAAVAVAGSAACPAILALGGATVPDAIGGSTNVLAAASLGPDGTPSPSFGTAGVMLLPSVRGPNGGTDPTRTDFWSATGAFASCGRVTLSYTPGFGLAHLIVPPPACPAGTGGAQ